MPIMRTALISLSHNRALQDAIVRVPVSRRMARRFVAGETLEEAIAAVLDLNERGMVATLDHLGENLILKHYIHVGVAVETPNGLVVPVVRDADRKGISEIAAELMDISARARERKLDLADLKGGTFSITNVGVIGGYAATPIINYPEVAILATMKIEDRAKVENGVVVVRRTLPLCLSFDHRVVDGAEAARFAKDLVRFLEEPGKLPLRGE